MDDNQLTSADVSLGYSHSRATPQRPPFPAPSLPRSTSTTNIAHPLTMATLNGLPYETLVECLSLLSCADLASTTRLSRRFHDISQPLLYKAPCLAKPTPSHRSSLAIFLQTLLTPCHEALGSHVRSLRLELDDTEPVAEFPDDCMALINAIASKLIIANPVSTQGPQLMILLDLLPRLHTLHISPPTVRFLEAASTLPRGLLSLRSLHYTRTPRIDFVKPKRILKVLQLPSLRHLHVPSITRFNMPIAALADAARSSRITHLRFSHAEPSAWVLRHILPVPIALTHFSYTAALNAQFDLARFTGALAPLRHSLEWLHLDFCGLGGVTGDQWAIGPFEDGEFREWPVLRTLRCSLVPLLGRAPGDSVLCLGDVLPRGLREMEVLGDWKWPLEDVVERVVGMLARKSEAAPGLERLAVRMEWGKTQRLVDRLTVACEAAGVCFVEQLVDW